MTAATVGLLRLGTPAEMRSRMGQKWRNRLNVSSGAGLSIRQRKLSSTHWLLHAERRQAREKGYRSLPPAFCVAFAKTNPGDAIVYEARHRGEPVAAALMLRHGRMATWQMGHSSPCGRQLNAMNLILWEAMQDLAARGHDQLDLGIMNDSDAPGVTRFKRGTGAVEHQLGGTWLHYGALAPLARRLPLRLAS